MAESSNGSLLSGEKTVSAANTAEALRSGELRVFSLLIIAKKANTGQVYVGGSDVTNTTNDGLGPGDSLSMEDGPSTRRGINLADVFIDVDTSGEGVDFYAVSG